MHISFGQGATDTHPRMRDMSFEQFIALVTKIPRHHGTLNADQYSRASRTARVQDKSGPWFIPASFTRPERRAACVDLLSGFVCDFDDGATTAAGIKSSLIGLRYMGWSSYSSTDDCPRYRVFIPYDQPIQHQHHLVNYEHFQRVFGGHLDHRCATTSQLWYLPGCPLGAPEPEIIVGSGSFFAPLRAAKTKETAVVTSALNAGDRDVNDDLTAGRVVSLGDIRSALTALDPSIYEDYTEWLNIGMAIYDGTAGSAEGLAIFTNWSRTVPHFEESVCEEKWRSFGGYKGRRVTVASLFKLAHTAGWVGVPCQSTDIPNSFLPVVSVSPSSGTPIQTSLHSGALPTQSILPLAISVTAPPNTWRAHPSEYAMQKEVEDPETGNKRWLTAIRGFKVMSVELLTYIGNGGHAFKITTASPAGQHTLEAAPDILHTKADLCGMCSNRGILLTEPESKDMQVLIMEWLKKIQQANRVKRAFSNFGWMEDSGAIVGFAIGETAFLSDGTTETGIKPVAHGGSAVAEYYKPIGDPAIWRNIAAFFAAQNKPEMMAVIATAFASPLMRFSGYSGAVVSIVSSASGVGKSTALWTAQAVWGHPKNAVHAADDTVASLSSKMGFIRNLPAYWDDIRGEKNLEQFSSVLYQITTGKEKSRSFTSGNMRPAETWHLLALVAANESIIDLVKLHGRDSDAGHARIFEMRYEERPTRAELQKAPRFDKLHQNFGHAGLIYAEWLAKPANQLRAETEVQRLLATLGDKFTATAEERYWFAAIATMVVGATYAKELGLVAFDIPGLYKCLIGYFHKLRGTKAAAVSEVSAAALISELIYSHQQSTLLLSDKPLINRSASIVRTPQNRGIDIVLCQKSPFLRIRRAQFNAWCQGRGFSAANLVIKLEKEGALYIRNADPFMGVNPYTTGNRTMCYDIDLVLLGLQETVNEQPDA